ncbi:uncharacterized protein EI90DRAFT_3033756 [Cantharellus anzutake]|uniref:uncharacterized protein n=1 Tax=Cantharellus anzutake TaxID=1750568 RepID=UPI001908047E|nr:uncharacterized protein EI90DRAFT_3033756 [Cantharellus anzutake]KAF8341377.1 hypothetical protein EI90DRAFT_3033756 [Cantharellus anzutake]
MSRRQSLSRKIDDILAAGGDMAIQVLRAVHSTADVFPPLKGATGTALLILNEVQMFQEDKKEWEDFGNYVVENVAEVVAAIRSYDSSSEEAKPWVESATKLDGALRNIQAQIEGKLTKMNKRPTLISALSPTRRIRVSSLRKDLDDALASFQLRVNLGIGVKLSAIGDSIGRLQRQNSWYLRHPHGAYHHSTGPCLNGTRVDLIERIMTWCRNTGDNDNRLMLLTAVAGAGKTSIAHTLAERCAKDEEDATLLLSFCFKGGEQSWPERLLSAIAQALESRDPVYRIFIASARRKDPALSMAPLLIQFKKLVASPLLHKPPLSNRPMVVIIDALDECNKKAFEPLAHILREEIPKLPSSIKFFITSRQSDIVNRFLSPHLLIDRLTINLSDDANVRDCAEYIRSELQALRSCHPEIRYRLQDEERTVQEISERAGGLFVWISTVFRYMKMANNDPMRTLEKLLGADAEGSAVSAEEMMDCLYTSILKKCDWADDDFVHDYPVVMGALFAAQQPLSIAAWDAILSPFLRSSVRYTLAELAPLLEGVENPYIPIRILHQSFRDFILDRIHPQLISLRCSPVDVRMGNAMISLRCTQILNQDLCSIESLGLIKNLSAQDELPHISPKELSEHLHYACRYIIYHLSDVHVPLQGLHESVRIFLGHHASRWVEVCVRMEGYVNISILPEWAKLAVDQKSKTAMRGLVNIS